MTTQQPWEIELSDDYVQPDRHFSLLASQGDQDPQEWIFVGPYNTIAALKKGAENYITTDRVGEHEDNLSAGFKHDISDGYLNVTNGELEWSFPIISIWHTGGE